MKIEEYKQVYDKMVMSQEGDERILRELLEERDAVPHRGRGRGKLAVAAGLAVAAAVAIFFAAGGSSLWRQGPFGNHPGTEMARRDRKATQKPDGDDGEKQKKPEDGNQEEERKNAGGKEEDGRDSGEPKEFQAQPVSYPSDRDEMEDLSDIKEGYLKNLLPFYQKAFQKMLTGKKGDNQVCSPVNLYFTMAMLSEMTAGESRAQIMKALGQTDGEEVREQSKKIWQWLYSDDEYSRCILGNSLWTRQGDPLKKSTLQTLSDYYYASTYQGEMGSKSYDQIIQKWLNKMTGGNLKDSVGKVETTGNTSLVLLSAADFYGTWVNDAFDRRNTEKGIFHAGSGRKVTSDFMHHIGEDVFYEEKRFTATSLGLSGGQSMYIFLPRKGSSLEELLEKDINQILHISTGAEEGQACIMNLKLPKFKIKGERDLAPTMKSMGVTEIFDQGNADFTGLLDVEKENGCYVGKASQAMQISVDEEGCSVSAYCEVVGKDKGAAVVRKKNMNCDRPFLVVISDRNGMPVFAGAVNQPNS